MDYHSRYNTFVLGSSSTFVGLPALLPSTLLGVSIPTQGGSGRQVSVASSFIDYPDSKVSPTEFRIVFFFQHICCQPSIQSSLALHSKHHLDAGRKGIDHGMSGSGRGEDHRKLTE